MLTCSVVVATRPTNSSISLGLVPAAWIRLGLAISFGTVCPSQPSLCLRLLTDRTTPDYFRAANRLDKLPHGRTFIEEMPRSAGVVAEVFSPATNTPVKAAFGQLKT